MLENKIKSIVAGHFRKDMPENVQRLAAYAYARAMEGVFPEDT